MWPEAGLWIRSPVHSIIRDVCILRMIIVLDCRLPQVAAGRAYLQEYGHGDAVVLVHSER